MLQRLLLAVAVGALSALSLLVALVIVAPGPADFLFESGTVEGLPSLAAGLAVLAAGAAIAGAGQSRRPARVPPR
jgi:hypothetical protein